jgi:hypothetical protein
MLDSAIDNELYLLHNGTMYNKVITKETLQNNYRLYNILNENSTTIITNDFLDNEFIFRNYIDEDDVSLIDIFKNSTQEKLKVLPTQIIEEGNNEIKYTV